MSGTNYRKVFKSDHLSRVDIEEIAENGIKPVFTIKEVRQLFGASVAGRKIDANIAYFEESIKPLVLNATNCKTLNTLTGSVQVENWSGVTVMLYVDESATLKGERVGGIRISPKKISTQKPELTSANTKLWQNAVAAYKRDGNFEAVMKRYVISDENQALIKEHANV